MYTAGFFAVTSGRPRAAVALLRGIDPDHDLGWLSDSAKSVYWRDLTAAEHLVGDYQTELAQARRLERRFPQRGLSHLAAARALAGLRRGKESLEELDVIMELPMDATARMQGTLSPGLIAYTIGIELLAHRDSAAGVRGIERAIEYFEGGPGRLDGRYERIWYSRALLQAARRDEALAEASVASRIDSTDVVYLGLRGFLAAYLGATNVAREIDARLAAIEQRDARGATWVHRSRLAMARADRATGLTYLRAATERGISRAPAGTDLHVDPVFAPLRGDPVFEGIIRSGE